MTLRIVFMGTPDFSVPCLNALLEAGHEVVAVVSQPSKPVGRGQHVQLPPVAEAAVAHGVPVHQWARLSDESYGVLRALAPDLCVVVAYGKILPQRYLDLPRLGCLNVHASLLPRWRGAAPIQWAVMEGDTRTGVCIMRMEAGLDTGPVAHEVMTAIGPDESAGALHDRLAVLGADALVETIAELEAGRVVFRPQPVDGATYAERLQKTHGLIDWSWSAHRVHDRVRGAHPWPGAYVELATEPVGRQAGGVTTEPVGRQAGGVTTEPFKILATRVLPDALADAPPGTVVALDFDGPRIACGSGCVVLTRVQRAGRKAVSGADFLRGAADCVPGTRL